MSPITFAQQLLIWYDQHGRKDLPWKQNLSAYRVWVSEIMLQQTQVATVIPYFQRFMARFPEVMALAQAPLDEVLALWAGLGYYARARNLHAAARVICDRHDNRFPDDFEQVTALPGIGRSTAGAILSLAAGQRHAILDGNVKRVLCRYHAVEGWSGNGAIADRLWQLAERHTPEKRVADYTQAVMDLGAMVCTRRNPRCDECPVADDCSARRQNRQGEFPTPKPRKGQPVRTTKMLMLCNERGEIFMWQRPPAGIWGGLWSLPECPADEDVVLWCQRELGLVVSDIRTWPVLRHTFSHFHLDITPIVAQLQNPTTCVMEPRSTVWYNSGLNKALGIPAPVQSLLNQLEHVTGVSK